MHFTLIFVICEKNKINQIIYSLVDFCLFYDEFMQLIQAQHEISQVETLRSFVIQRQIVARLPVDLFKSAP